MRNRRHKIRAADAPRPGVAEDLPVAVSSDSHLNFCALSSSISENALPVDTGALSGADGAAFHRVPEAVGVQVLYQPGAFTTWPEETRHLLPTPIAITWSHGKKS